MVSIRQRENGLGATGSAWLVLALAIASASARPYLEDEMSSTVSYKAGSVAYQPGWADDRGPGGEGLNELANNLNDNRTAWGSVPFDYPNISRPWREVSDTPGWSWDITLEADVETLVAMHPPAFQTLYMTEGVLSLQTPTSGNGSALPVDDEWNLCLLRWDLGNQKYNDKLRTDDGTCSSVLSAACSAALREKVENSFTAHGTCACVTAAAVPECAGDDTGPWDSGCHAAAFNASEMAGWAGGRHPLFGFASGGVYDAGDIAVYNNLGSVAWPVLSALSGGGLANGTVYGRSQLACVRATHAAEGWAVPALSAKNTTEAGQSKEDGPVKTNAASGRGVGSLGAFWLAFGFLVSAFVI